MPLTDMQLRTLPFEARQRDYPDRDGLFVRVGRKTKTFMVTVRENGQRRRVAIGHYPDITLAAARVSARKLQTEARNKPETPRVTFAEVLESYYRIHGPKQRLSTHTDCQRVLNRYFRPILGGRDIDTIRTIDLAAIIDAVERPSRRHAAYAWIVSFFNWAYRRGYLENLPTARLEPQPAPEPREHVPTPDEIGRIWHACPDTSYGQIIKLCIVSAQRVGQWEKYRPEFRQGDVIVWPASVMKAGRAHTLPVTPLLASLLPEQPIGRRLDTRSKWRLDRVSGVTGWRVHDMRRAFATYAADELGITPHVIEAVLAHVSGTQVSRVYNRSKQLGPMRDALLAYEAWLKKVCGTP